MNIAVIAPERSLPWRSRWPAEWAAEYGNVDVTVWDTVLANGGPLCVNDGTVRPDVVFMPVPSVPSARAVEKAVEDGQRVIIDVADWPWADGRQHATLLKALRAATLVTCPTPHLAERLRLKLRRDTRVQIVADAIATGGPEPDGDPEPIPTVDYRTVGWAGSTDELADLAVVSRLWGHGVERVAVYSDGPGEPAEALLASDEARFELVDVAQETVGAAIVTSTSVMQALSWVSVGVPVVMADSLEARMLRQAGLVDVARRPADWAKMLEPLQTEQGHTQRVIRAGLNLRAWTGEVRWVEWVAAWVGAAA